MFSLPAAPATQTVIPDDQLTLPDGSPVIPVTETSKVMDKLLRLVYPVNMPSLDDVAEVAEVLLVGRKYQMSSAGMSVLSSAFDKFASSLPLRCFALACKFGMEDKARRAAKCLLTKKALSLKMSEDPSDMASVPEVEHVTAGALFRLQWYSRMRGNVAEFFQFIDRSHDDGTTEDSSQSPVSVPSPNDESEPTDDDTKLEPIIAGWLTFSAQLDRIPADLHVHSSIDSTVDLPAHKLVLALSSPVLADKIARSTARDDSDAGLPVICLSEDGEILQHLLQFCYGSFGSIIDSESLDLDSDMFVHIIRAAQRYSMDKIQFTPIISQ
ncbi:hypothetical protein EUX98_g7174 [Antrodiella citrinella]|uniref:BTB domain-containing protein n=1 Tax=Antrodiella citrinella TaxID=2447956 RepID=A0A4V3XHX2_9APHY|nr:hypothetical protein EUX98_g7174 [Antrodiella citrinella]